MLNEDQIKGKMKYVQGKIKETWGKLTDDVVSTFDGKSDQVAGKVQEHYGIAKDEFAKKVHQFETEYEQDEARRNSSSTNAA